MDNKLKEVLIQVGITTLSILIAMRINSMLNSYRVVPPQKVEN